MERGPVSVATAWSAVDVVLRQGLQFGVAIALARLLDPDEFGKIAFVMALTALAAVFVDGGFGAALVQKQDATHEDESTVFWFNVAVATVLLICLIVAAPQIGEFFRIPDLSPVIAGCSSILVISSASSVHTVLLTKKLDFKTQAKIGAATVVFSGATAIALALKGFGVWALVLQAVVAATTTTIMSWMLFRWTPAFAFRFSSLKAMFPFGGFMMLTIAIDTIAARASALALGYYQTTRDLGYYVRAETTAALPSALAQRIVPRVTFSAYSSISHDVERLRDEIVNAQGAANLLIVPSMLGLATVAEPLVLTLFGEKWLPSVTVLQILACAGLGMTYQVINLSAVMALGRSKLFFVTHFVKKVVLLLLIAITAPLGLTPIACAVLFGAIVGACIDILIPGRLLKLTFRAQLFAARKVAAAAALMGAVVYLFVSISNISPPWELALAVAIGGGVYSPLVLIFRDEAALRLLAQIKVVFGLEGTRRQ